jgi:DNA polymerase V
MTTLEQFTDELEIYSIDEAFLKLHSSVGNEAFAQTIRQTVRQWTRIPVSIGIAPTKVLAKVANHMAKKYPHFNGVCDITNEDVAYILHDLPVEELWGIGRKSTKKLKTLGVHTAAELLLRPDTWIRKHLSISGLHIVYELRGIPCFKLDDVPEPKKGIMCTRSFGTPITTKDELKEAVATYTERVAEKLREAGLAVSYFYVYIRTNRFNLDKKYIGSKGVHLPVATSYTPLLVKQAMELVDAIYRDGYRYAKAGVCCTMLVPEKSIQQNLFAPVNFAKNDSLMKAVDRVNRHFGKDTIFMAGSGLKKGWSMKNEHQSKRFTTSIAELPLAR